MSTVSRKMKAKKVVVFGSCNIDLFFDVPNMDFFGMMGVGAQDALHFATHKQAPGGKGANQAVAAAKAGAKVFFYGGVGKGAHGRFVLDNFKSVGINTKGVHVLDAPTGVAVIFNQPNGKHKSVVSHGANDVVKEKIVPNTMVDDNSILVFQSETDLKQNMALVKRGHKRGATIVYNVAPAVSIPPETLMCIDYLILNRPEAEVVAESVGLSAGNLPLFAEAMARKFNLVCIVTLGELGILVSGAGGNENFSLPSMPIKAVDTIGAGDAFVGGFVAALAGNCELYDALLHGIVAGSLACTKVGAQSALPTVRDIEKNLPKLRQQIAKSGSKQRKAA